MDYWFLMIAAFLSLAGMLFHGFIGGKIYVSNVNDSDMEALTKSLSMVSWHVFTIFLFISALTLIYIAYNPEFAIAAYPVICLLYTSPSPRDKRQSRMPSSA